VFVLAEKVEMVVVGPEDPLVKESMTFKRWKLSHPVIGPSKIGAQLEGSKDLKNS
jgi:phosphoribosylamine--glycine ligase